MQGGAGLLHDHVQHPYQRIAEALRGRILSGELSPGSQLPSENDLAREHETTRVTVRKAVALLKADGLVVSHQGKGAFVRPRPRVRLLASGPNYRARRDTGVSNFNAEVLAQGQLPEQRIREVAQVTPPPEVAARLELATDDDSVVVRRRLFLVDGEPVQLCDGYYPYELARGTQLLEPARIRGGVHAVLENPAGPIGRTIRHFVEDLEIRMPTPDEVEALAIPPGVPVARVFRTAYDEQERPIEVLDSIVPCDRHVFRYVIDVPEPSE